MGQQTPEQIKEEMVSKLGKEFGCLLYSIYNEITWLTFKWIEFRELFGEKQSRFELMNSTAPFFFFTVQKVLWENLLLGVARITDPAVTMSKKNTTLNAISQYLEDQTFKTDFENSLTNILNDSKFCRDWRNRWIAHMDYELAVNPENAKPLEEATRRKLRTSLEDIQSLYNEISFKYFGSTVGWEMLSSNRGAIALLYRIEDGIRFDEEVHRRKLDDDWEPDHFISKV